MEGLEFVMTALFVVIFLEQWKSSNAQHSALLGVGISIVCLIVFGSGNFILPSMFLIITVLTLLRKQPETAGETTCP